MRGALRVLVLAAVACGILTFPLAAGAGHTTDPSENLTPLGHIEEPAVLGGFGGANPDINTDIAFWGKFAIQGNWDGFSIRDISDSNNPTTVGRAFCDGNQGDVTVWNNIVVRSWNTPGGPRRIRRRTDVRRPARSGRLGGNSRLQHPRQGEPARPRCRPRAAPTRTHCPGQGERAGPHLQQLVRPFGDGPESACHVRLDRHHRSASGGKAGNASYLRAEPSEHTCHDIGVILGSVKKAACAGGEGFRVFSLGGPDGGLEDPELLYHVTIPGVTIGHSAAFSADGDVIIFGHEPRRSHRRVRSNRSVLDRSFSSSTRIPAHCSAPGSCPHAQGPTENCTLHNYNVVPSKKRDLLVSGNYQAGTWVVDFTDPAAAFTVAWSDPPPKPVPPGTPFCCDVTGAWSSYWYRTIYETNIGEGLNIFGPDFSVQRIRPCGT